MVVDEDEEEEVEVVVEEDCEEEDVVVLEAAQCEKGGCFSTMNPCAVSQSTIKRFGLTKKLPIMGRSSRKENQNRKGFLFFCPTGTVKPISGID